MQLQIAKYCLGAILLLATLLIGGCDYPQAGYYALIGLNHTGEQVASIPFLVEEITDDSHMTTGFMLLLPKDQTLVEVPILNSEDISHRNWTFSIATEDSQAGSLVISFAHFKSMLSFSGEYQAAPTIEPWPVAGKVAADKRSSWLEFNGGLPYLHQSLSSVFSFELVQSSLDEFEIALGCPVDEALRNKQLPVSLEVVEAFSEDPPHAPRKQLQPPTPPTRGDNKRGR